VNPVGEDDVVSTYRDFADRQTGSSPTFHAWAQAVLADPEVLALIGTLPTSKQQPNLVFAAARWHGAAGAYDDLHRVLVDHWDAVRAVVLTRSTQTNEVARCASLLPVLASLPGPLALLEVGASAGLCLYPDRYSYRWGGGVSLDPVDGPSDVVLSCTAHGGTPLPDAVPEVRWRGGVDLNPLDVRDDDAMRWLETLVWPEHDERRERLRAAVGVVRRDPPALVRGDALEALPALVETVPDDATLVVFHSAVLAYFSAEDRDRFVDLVSGLRGHWVSNEGARVLPSVAATATTDPPPVTPFLLGLDGRALAWTDGHTGDVWWF
jgi:hypothetical protein